MEQAARSCTTCLWCRVTPMRPTFDRDPHHDCLYRPPANMRKMHVTGLNGELYAEAHDLGTTVQPDDWCSEWQPRDNERRASK